jgi:hypothetical protein
MAELVEAAEAVESVVEPVVSEVIKTAHMIDRRVAFVSLALCTVGGALAGYGVAGKRLATKYQKLADDEIAVMREHYILKQKANQPKPPLETLLDTAEKVIEKNGYVAPQEADKPAETPPDRGEPTVVVQNIFNNGQPEDVWDYATEVKSRNPAQPYIIHKNEFHEGFEEHEQSTLTFFTGDDVLCDERDAPIDDVDALVGLENLEQFGHGSGDVNVVYIRNEPLGRDIEIVRSSGKFATEVHGFQDDELKHSERRQRPQRGFRGEE